jgi:hypothetical protein
MATPGGEGEKVGNASSSSQSIHIPAHRDFREKYFQGFKKPSDA